MFQGWEKNDFRVGRDRHRSLQQDVKRPSFSTSTKEEECNPVQKNNNTYFTTSYAMLVLKLLLFHDNKTKMYSPFDVQLSAPLLLSLTNPNHSKPQLCFIPALDFFCYLCCYVCRLLAFPALWRILFKTANEMYLAAYPNSRRVAASKTHMVVKILQETQVMSENWRIYLVVCSDKELEQVQTRLGCSCFNTSRIVYIIWYIGR